MTVPMPFAGPISDLDLLSLEAADGPLLNDPVGHPEARSFDMPRGIWPVMFASYAILFLMLTLATGHDGQAIFMIVVGVGYTVMYFFTAAVLKSVGDPGTAEPPRDFDILTGRISYGASFAQILAVPLMFALFGISIAVIRALV